MRHGFTGNLKTRNCDGLRKCEQKMATWILSLHELIENLFSQFGNY